MGARRPSLISTRGVRVATIGVALVLAIIAACGETLTGSSSDDIDAGPDGGFGIDTNSKDDATITPVQDGGLCFGDGAVEASGCSTPTGVGLQDCNLLNSLPPTTDSGGTIVLDEVFVSPSTSVRITLPPGTTSAFMFKDLPITKFHKVVIEVDVQLLRLGASVDLYQLNVVTTAKRAQTFFLSVDTMGKLNVSATLTDGGVFEKRPASTSPLCIGTWSRIFMRGVFKDDNGVPHSNMGLDVAVTDNQSLHFEIPSDLVTGDAGSTHTLVGLSQVDATAPSEARFDNWLMTYE